MVSILMLSFPTLMLFFKAEVSKKTVVQEKRFVAEEKRSVSVPHRVEVTQHEGTEQE